MSGLKGIEVYSYSRHDENMMTMNSRSQQINLYYSQVYSALETVLTFGSFSSYSIALVEDMQ
jgi:hypothetical protein